MLKVALNTLTPLPRVYPELYLIPLYSLCYPCILAEHSLDPYSLLHQYRIM